MKYFCFFIFSLHSYSIAFAQDTIHMHTHDIHVLSSQQKLYFFVPSNNDNTDSVVVINRAAYYDMQRDNQACSTFVHLYQLYKTSVHAGDLKVQRLINGYEVVIQSKDSSYTALMKQYEALHELNNKSMQQTTSTIRICRSSLDSLATSLNILQQENSLLQKDLTVLKKQHRKQKWGFALGALAAGLVIGILLVH